jgi:enoyl-CoA hydratase/carnithine racemase
MPSLTVTKSEGVETWALDFPPVNALNESLLSAVEQRLDELDQEADTCVVLVTSSLRVFSAGADAKWMAAVIESDGAAGLLDRFHALMDRFRTINLRIRRSPVLFVAVIGGHALAGGLELAAACDLRFAADDERLQIGAPEMSLFGETPSGGGGTQFLTRLMGPSRCLEFILRAEPCSPKEALALGLVDRILPVDPLLDDSAAFATRLASKAGRIGVNSAKRLILDASSMPFEAAIEYDRQLHWDTMRRGGFLAGVEEFVARYGRRTP